MPMTVAARLPARIEPADNPLLRPITIGRFWLSAECSSVGRSPSSMKSTNDCHRSRL